MKNDSDNRPSGRDLDPLDKLLRLARWPDEASDPLDKLLRMAQWPEPAADSLPPWRQQLARCRSRCAAELIDARPHLEPSLALRRKKRRKAWIIVGSGVVAAFFLAMALWSLRLPGDKSPAGVPTKVAHDLAPKAPQPDETTVSRDTRPTNMRETSPEPLFENPVATVNSPLVLRAMQPEALYLRMLRARGEVRERPEDGDPVDRIVAQRIAEPDGDLQELVQPLLAERAESEQQLLERFHTFDGERAAAAIELLGCVGSEASAPRVLQLSFDPVTHAPAVRALLKIADTRILARLALSESDPELRDEITAALRARGEKQTLFFVLAAQGDYSCLEPGLDLWQPVE